MSFFNEYRDIIIEVIKAAIVAIAAILVYIICTRGKRKKEKSVKKQAYTDELTQKGNRYLFYLELDKLIEQDKNLAVCFMDLDGFKQTVSETYAKKEDITSITDNIGDYMVNISKSTILLTSDLDGNITN